MDNERQLVEYCISNKEGALDELYRVYAPKLFGICLRYGKNQQEAEDILHNGFIRILKYLKEFRYEGSFEGWLRRIMLTTAINYYKKNTRYFADIDISNVPDNEEYHNPVSESVSLNELLEIINSIPDGYREIFNLYVIDGYKHKEISKMLDISESTSKSQYMKARKFLQKKLLEMNYDMPYNIIGS